MEGLSINNLITNEDIVVTYTPSVFSYSYVIIKDNVYGEPIYVYDGSLSEFRFTEEGHYKIEVTIEGIVVTVGEYIIDKTTPILNIAEKTYTITTKELFDVNDKISASDSREGDLTEKISTNEKNLDFTIPGIKKIE